jgi:hypothetical protein
VPEASPLVKALYARNSAGCCLHIVLDDGNVRDSDVDCCIESARKKGHADCETLALLLRKMSRTQRGRL